MEQPYIGFYRSRVKMFVKMFLYLLVAGLFISLAFYANSAFSLLFFGLFGIVFFILFVLSIIEILRDKPYIRFTKKYFILFPESYLELKVDYADIDYISVTETNLQKTFNVELKNESLYFDQLSSWQMLYYGQNKLFALPIVVIHNKLVDKNVRPLFFTVMEDVVALTEKKITSLPLDYLEKEKEREESFSEAEVIENIDPNIARTIPLTFDMAYFKSAYLVSLIYFVIIGIFAHFIIESADYLTLSIISFFAYPFAKVIADMIGLQKFREKLYRQRGGTVYFYRILYAFEIVLFHLSILLFPIGVLLLILHLVMRKFNRRDDV